MARARFLHIELSLGVVVVVAVLALLGTLEASAAIVLAGTLFQRRRRGKVFNHTDGADFACSVKQDVSRGTLWVRWV